MTETLTQMMYPFSKQPEAGKRIRVFLKDGTKRKAFCCNVYSKSFTGLQWYGLYDRKSIDVNQIKGWWPL